jgi:type II secretory pathway component PulC
MLTAFLLAGLAHSASAADYRFVGSTMPLPGQEGPSHAVFETPDGQQLIVDAGQQIGGCRLASVSAQTATMACADGWISLALRSDLHGRNAPSLRRTAEYRVKLPRERVFAETPDRRRSPRQMSLEPEVRDGMLSGYRVAWIDPGGDFRRLGLKEDDVIVSLNDVSAARPGAFMQAFNGLRGQSSFHLALERSGALIGYTYLLD